MHALSLVADKLQRIAGVKRINMTPFCSSCRLKYLKNLRKLRGKKEIEW